MVVALVATAAIDALVAIIKHKKGGNLKNEIIDSVVKNYSYVTAIIFTLCCPVYVSYYVIIIGCLAATGIKHCFGGFGKNIFNPAIIGRIVVGMTTDERAWRKLNLSWGVKPVLSEEYNSIEVVFYQAFRSAVKELSLKCGDNVVLTGGQINGAPGNTNTIKVETVK